MFGSRLLGKVRERAAVLLIEAGYWLGSGRRMAENLGAATVPADRDDEPAGGYAVAMSDKARRMVDAGAAAPPRTRAPAAAVHGPLPGSAAARLQAARDGER